MIDTDKTEQWLQHDDHLYEVLQVAALDLLAEVKRLREEPRVTIDDWDKVVGSEHTGPYVTLYFEDGSEYIGALRLYKGICECCDEEGEHDD